METKDVILLFAGALLGVASDRSWDRLRVYYIAIRLKFTRRKRARIEQKNGAHARLGAYYEGNLQTLRPHRATASGREIALPVLTSPAWLEPTALDKSSEDLFRCSASAKPNFDAPLPPLGASARSTRIANL